MVDINYYRCQACGRVFRYADSFWKHKSNTHFGGFHVSQIPNIIKINRKQFFLYKKAFKISKVQDFKNYANSLGLKYEIKKDRTINGNPRWLLYLEWQ